MHDARHKIGELIRNLLVVGAGNYGAMGVALVTNAVLTRRLGVEQFGRLALLLTTSQVVSLLVSNWTHIGLIRFGAREFKSAGSMAETFWTRVWIVAPWGLAAALVMLLFGDRVSAYLTIPRWGLFVVFAHFLASLALVTVGAVFQAKEDMHRYGAVLFFDKAVMAALVFALPLSLARDPLFVLGMYAASSTAVAVWGLVSLGKHVLLPVVFRGDAYRGMLAFSMPLILSSWSGLFGTSWFDLLVIRRYWPLSDLGFYSLGTVLAGVMQQVTIIFSSLLLPQLSVMAATGDVAQMRRLVDRLFPYWFLGTSVLFSLALVSATFIVPLIFGRAFQPTVPVLSTLILAACGLAIFSALSPLVSAFGSTWVLTGIYFASGAANVVMDLLLVPRFGIGGAAVASVFACGTAAVLVMAFVKARVDGSIFSLGLFVLPVAVVYLCFRAFEGIAFYLLALPAAALTIYWLVRRFGLFSGTDAVFLKDMRLMRSVPPVVTQSLVP